MEDNIRKISVFGHEEFDKEMLNREWFYHPVKGYAVISITSEHDSDPEHWFDDYTPRVLNLDIEDVIPVWWTDKDMYNRLPKLFKENQLRTKILFDFAYENMRGSGNLNNIHIMNIQEALETVRFIHTQLKEKETKHFFIHCEVGVSRSQAIAKFIMDKYPEYEWVEREENKCEPLAISKHIYEMLCIADRIEDEFKANPDEYKLPHKDILEDDEFKKFIESESENLAKLVLSKMYIDEDCGYSEEYFTESLAGEIAEAIHSCTDWTRKKLNSGYDSEREIRPGKSFKKDGKEYLCIGNPNMSGCCEGCAFNKTGKYGFYVCGYNHYRCKGDERYDSANVIFIEKKNG